MAMQWLQHAAKESKFMKLFLGAFIFLAVGGLVFTDVTGSFSGATGSRTVASVNGEKLNLREFDRDLNNALRMTGLSPQEAYQAGLINAFLQGQINNELQMQAAQKLNLVISDEMVAQQISRVFSGMSKEDIQATLRAQGLSEQQFADSIRANLMSRTLQQIPLAVSNYVPAYMKRVDARLQAERRGGIKYTLPLNKFTEDVNVTDEDLLTYYQSNIANYTVAEDRIFSIGTMAMAQATKNLPVITDADVKQAYDDNPENFRVPEKRTLSQATVKDPDEAQAVYEQTLEGASLKTALKSIIGSDKAYRKAADYTKDGLAAELALMAFDTDVKKGNITPPIQTALGYTLMEIGDVTPSFIQPFNDVQKDLKASLQDESRFDALYNKIVEAEDLIDAGQSFDAVVGQLGLKIQSTAAYSREAIAVSDDKLLTEIFTASPSVLNELYAIPEGNAAYPVELDDKFIIIGVSSVTPQTILPFEDVKTDIEKIVRQAQLKSFANNTLNELVGTLNTAGNETPLAESIFQSAVKKTFKNISRLDETPLAGTIYNTDLGKYGYIMDDRTVTLVKVDSIDFVSIKPQTDEQIATMRQSQRMALDSFLGQYYADKASISINESLLERTYGDNSSL